MEYKKKITKMGNSSGILINKVVLETLGVKRGDTVLVNVTKFKAETKE